MGYGDLKMLVKEFKPNKIKKKKKRRVKKGNGQKHNLTFIDDDHVCRVKKKQFQLIKISMSRVFD